MTRRAPTVVTTDARSTGIHITRAGAQPSAKVQNTGIFDFALTPSEVAAPDAPDTGARGGPDPELVDPKRFPLPIPD